MPDFDVSTLATLLWLFAGILVVIVMLFFRISWRLARIESIVVLQRSRPETKNQAPSREETSQGGAFEAFLSEDPSRRKLKKSERFSAYRKWRQENGMNWPESPGE
jgi:hypothetical protein